MAQKEREFLEYTEDLSNIRVELKSLTDKLNSLENKGQLQWILFAVKELLRNKAFLH